MARAADREHKHAAFTDARIDARAKPGARSTVTRRMLLLPLLVVLQAGAVTAPKSAASAPQPPASALELPQGARLLFTVDGGGLEIKRIDHLGKGLAALGDMNGDGTPDFLAGSVSGVPGLTQERGFAEVFSGKDGSKLLRVDGHKGDEGDGFGIRVGRLGDLDGDGVGEFFVGGEPGEGEPYLNVYAGKNAALLHTFVSGAGVLEGLYDPSDFRPIGDVDGDAIDDYALVCDRRTCIVSKHDWRKLSVIDGSVIGRAADIDGDGVRDFFCQLDDYEKPVARVAGIVSGKLEGGKSRGALLARADVPDAGPLYSWSWAATGDANGDGYLDAVFAFYDSPRTTWTSPAKEKHFCMQLVSGKDASVLREWWE